MALTLRIGDTSYVRCNVQLTGSGYGNASTPFVFSTTNSAICALVGSSGNTTTLSNLGGSAQIIGVGAGSASINVTLFNGSSTFNAPPLPVTVTASDLGNVSSISLSGGL
jgi:hypothetical protein